MHIQPYHYQADQIWCDGLFNLGLRIRIKKSCWTRVHVFNIPLLILKEKNFKNI